MAGAALFHSIALNHCLYNGNKRSAVVALLAFLDVNDLVVTCEQKEVFRFVLRVASHRVAELGEGYIADREVLEIARWVRSNSRRIVRGERSMKWLRLRQRLNEFGCMSEPAGTKGNRLNISRILTLSRRGLIRRTKSVTLRTQVAWAGDGTDADKNVIHKIRRDLQLDDEHDVDSSTFYDGAIVDYYIIEYRRILKRLAKL